MKCDICNAAGPGNIVSAAQIRGAVFNHKFDPFALGLFSGEVLQAAGRSAATAYQNWLPMVGENETDWNLCPRCFAGITPYLEKAARDPVVPPTPSASGKIDFKNVDELGKSCGMSPELAEMAFGPLRDAMRRQSGAAPTPSNEPVTKPAQAVRNSNEKSRSTPITRSKKITLLKTGFGLACLVGAIALWVNEHPIWMIIVGLVSLRFFWEALSDAGLADCPACGQKLSCLSKKGLFRCPRCERYSQAAKGVLTELPQDSISTIPAYSIDFQPGNLLLLPYCCCGCGGPATITELVKTNFDDGYKVSTEVPYCSSCKNSAVFDNGETPRQQYRLLVKSYHFYRECLKMNGRWKDV